MLEVSVAYVQRNAIDTTVTVLFDERATPATMAPHGGGGGPPPSLKLETIATAAERAAARAYDDGVDALFGVGRREAARRRRRANTDGGGGGDDDDGQRERTSTVDAPAALALLETAAKGGHADAHAVFALARVAQVGRRDDTR